MPTAWSAWIPDVAGEVTGAPSFSIELAVKRTVTDFLERTHWLQRTAAPIDIAGGAVARTFPVSVIAAGERVLAILGAWVSDKPVEVYGPDDVDEDWPDWKTRTGTPECLVQERDDEFYVVPSPASTMTAALRLKVAVGLLDAATTCDDSIVTNWREGIAAGAKARLMLQPGKTWESPERAAVNQAMYMEAVNKANTRVARGAARRPLYVRPSFF